MQGQAFGFVALKASWGWAVNFIITYPALVEHLLPLHAVSPATCTVLYYRPSTSFIQSALAATLQFAVIKSKNQFF